MEESNKPFKKFTLIDESKQSIATDSTVFNKLNIELLNRVKDDVAKDMPEPGFGPHDRWEEVIKRLVHSCKDEIKHMRKCAFDDACEISQLKKQLEDMTAQRDFLKSTDPRLKSKLEVKEKPAGFDYKQRRQETSFSKRYIDKPNFEKIASDIFGLALNGPAKSRVEGFIDGCEKIWNDYVVPRNSKIAELEKEIDKLKHKNTQ